MYLVCYDIQEDKLRTRLAKKLKLSGLERLQFSVFIGELSEAKHARLLVLLQDIIAKSKVPEDSTAVFPLHEDALQATCTFGRPLDYFLFPPNTLFFK